jgi:hypothetical protein
MRRARSRWLELTFDWLLRAEALALVGLVLATALHNVSLATDVWYYHMPLATRIAGIVKPSSFRFAPMLEEFYATFPLLGELIQGVLWRVFGRAEAANLFSFSSLPLFAWFLRRQFAVPLHLSVLALLAVPLIHIHASSALIDLPTGCLGAALLLITVQAFISKTAPSLRRLLWVAALSAFAVNTKAFVHPLSALCIASLGLRAIVLSKTVPEAERLRYRLALVGGALLLPLVFFTPLRNAIVYGNPYFPFQLKLLGHQLPGSWPEFAPAPVYLEHTARPLRFATSLFELRNLPYSDPMRWQAAQFTPAKHEAYLMGGFFGLYVAFHLALLLFRVLSDRSRELRTAAVAFALLTALTSVLPQSHELRYYMYWIISLISINLWFACKPDAKLIGPRLMGLTSTLALAVVITVTRGVYTLPTGKTFQELVQEQVRARALAGVRNGETVCVMRYPYNLLWAAEFHPGRDYVVQEAYAPSGCQGFRRVGEPGRRRKRRH